MSVKAFEPCKIGTLEVKNRFVRSATRDAMATPSGAVTDASVALYRGLARGGIGLIITGHAFVSAHGQAVPGQYGVHNDDMIAGLRRLAEAAHAEDAAIALQISHAGINSDFFREKNMESLAVSMTGDMPQPHRELTGGEIESIIAFTRSGLLVSSSTGLPSTKTTSMFGVISLCAASTFLSASTYFWPCSTSAKSSIRLPARFSSTITCFPAVVR